VARDQVRQRFRERVAIELPAASQEVARRASARAPV